jgi:hypothetical protein
MHVTTPTIAAFQVTEFGPDHRLEYFVRNGEVWVREIKGERSLEQTLHDMLTHDPWERACYFAGIERRPASEAKLDPGMNVSDTSS